MKAPFRPLPSVSGLVASVNTCLYPFAFLALILVGKVSAQTVYDMSDPVQFANNFMITSQAAGSTLGVSGGKLQDVTTTAGTATWVYDTTPDSTATNASFQNFTTSMLVNFGASNSGIGFYFFDGGNRSNSLLALVNVNNGSSNDIIRFFSGASLTAGSAGTQQGTTTTLTNGAFELNNNYLLTLTANYIGAGQVDATLTLSDPNSLISAFSASYSFTGVAAMAGEIGFRSSTALSPATNAFDDFSIPAVPEPTVMAFLGLGIILITVTIKRRGLSSI
ncbi:MAG: hypothetical protein B9S32_17215 [Verrucomicrobia bacterium Tous-C9LFEB]|nr:MAG: hypothetical protein B9S32_17215 [Verrucomicrobia bacterium Tous-C9LFEB]